jgi:putative SOS response-associated peptidase YedK
MCGAFSILHPFRDLSQRFNAGYNDSLEYPRRYNARPSQQLPVILSSDPEQIVLASWGYPPPWKGAPIINARKESLNTKVMYSKSFHERRCLVLADGFYEWGHIEQKKIPFRFTLSSEEPFAFAGIYRAGEETAGKSQAHFAIITVEPNELVAKVHNRMPAILPAYHEKEWLNPDHDTAELLTLLAPYPSHLMKAYPVSTLVNSPKNDVIDVIKPARI